MKLVNGYDLIDFAQRHGLVLPAFNTTNMEMTYAIARGLNKAGLPGFIQISSNNLRLSSPKVIVDLARDAVKDSEVPIALHLDHGRSFADVKACCDAGFTSIMVDASALPFEENVRACRKACEYCHFYGLPVEVELGALRGKEDDEVNEADAKTDPERVADFVARTGCDLLAVSVGNVHGLCLNPQIDMPLLALLHQKSAVPLVLHGGSGIAKEVIWEAKKHGLIKINYGSDLRKEFIRSFGEAFEADHNVHDVISLSIKAVDQVADKVAELVTWINAR